MACVITITGPSYLDVLMRVPHLAQEGEKVRGQVGARARAAVP